MVDLKSIEQLLHFMKSHIHLSRYDEKFIDNISLLTQVTTNQVILFHKLVYKYRRQFVKHELFVEKLVELHEWSDMARLARSGGEANAIAIRIARAASGRDKVAVCGYHGWHDWYLSSNLGNNKALDNHLLAGLETKGVPRNLQNTVFPFHYNRFDELEA